MYQRYFGFKERPFRLSPDPAYLFMGESHREAMARLMYAVRSGEGFATVIGEVGTGKTTLCRSWLDRFDAGVSSAFIFNPPRDPVDLIRAVNRDFGLPVETDNLHDLIEALNRFLIREKAAGRTVILVIDEAQHLSRPVLEQVRLLSNLETTRHKLLLIVLVGQPELQVALEKPDLRQLRQRITSGCRLAPLTLAETGAYIRHRLAVAATGEPVVFTSSAIRVLFRHSKGIPRLINMACERSLITAYANAGRRIDGAVARQAVKELAEEASGRPRFFTRPKLLGAGLLATLTLAGITVGLDSSTFRNSNGKVAPIVSPIEFNRPLPKTPPPPAQIVGTQTAVETHETSWRMNRKRALVNLAGLWGIPAGLPEDDQSDDPAFFRSRSQPLGLSVRCIAGRPDLVERLNLPALLVLAGSDPLNTEYAVLAGIKGGQYHLMDGTRSDRRHPLSGRALTGQWSGMAYVFWRDFYGLSKELSLNATDETVIDLKRMLQDLGYANLALNLIFDETTRQAIIDFQGRQGLPVDGVVGSLTKMALYNTRPELAVPKLRTDVGGGPEKAF